MAISNSITFSDVGNFIQGNSNYYLGSPAHVREQAEFRALLCRPCLIQGKCKQCGCSTPTMFYSPNKEDHAGR